MASRVARASAACWWKPARQGFEVTGTYHTMGGENLHEIQFNDWSCRWRTW